LVGDAAGWVLDREVLELSMMAQRLGVRLADARWWDGAQCQSVFYMSQFVLRHDAWTRGRPRVALSYFHGRPGQGIAEFDAVFRALQQSHDRLDRVHVSHRAMRDVVLESGIAPSKVFLIPIAVNSAVFPRRASARQRLVRARYGIPEGAAVVGSFQKDGVGWGDGLEPKLIKGPDVFVQTLVRLKPRVPEVFALLSGPARGYVKRELDLAGIPYRHVYARDYEEVGELYHALDLYIVSAREEGGPKAVLESMASGVPLVTTRVGQAMDLVRHGENGFMVDVEDVDGLAHWAEYVLGHAELRAAVIAAGRRTADANTYERQAPQWRDFMRGFVSFAGSETR
jgi:glycosyltransferase involved in cell wall biosynthesis